MTDISKYTDDILVATYGEEVRESIVGAINKVNDDNNSYWSVKDEILKAKLDVRAKVNEFGIIVENSKDAKIELEAQNKSAKNNILELRSENFNSSEILKGISELRARLDLAPLTTVYYVYGSENIPQCCLYEITGGYGVDPYGTTPYGESAMQSIACEYKAKNGNAIDIRTLVRYTGKEMQVRTIDSNNFMITIPEISKTLRLVIK